jgi:4-hydroxy-tetrahydrodipicolinate reductase
MRIAIVGNGRMGKAVAAMAVDHGHTIHTVVESAENAGGQALTRERLAGADVAIEFSRPDAAVRNLEKLAELGISTVTGTTGWHDALPLVTAFTQAHRGALLHSANFSVGVHLFLRTAPFGQARCAIRYRPAVAATARHVRSRSFCPDPLCTGRQYSGHPHRQL